ncbi:MAG: cytochrome C [Pseudomonadota bacterium]|nr:cytochrome C [Pseudomonadota bacterium]
MDRYTRRGYWGLVGCAAILAVGTSPARAVPAFARQTGQNCIACHISFPELTPYGRWFKLSGYTIGTRQALPLAMMAQVARTRIKNNDDGTGTGTPVTARDGAFALNGASLFAAGKASDNVGGFVQWTFSETYNTDGSRSGHSASDNTDLRWVGRMTGSDAEDVKLLYGLTVHNNPTVQDVWNSTPAFGYPYTVSPTATFGLPSTKIEGALAQQVAGIGFYGFYDRTWYAELTAYHAADGLFSVFRAGHDFSDRLSGFNPYLRLAYNKEWGAHSVMLGAFGLRAKEHVDPADSGSALDRYTDIGVDAQYQYITNPHTFTAQATLIREWQHLDATFAQGGSANPSNRLNSIKLKATYYFERMVGVTVSEFARRGSVDTVLYAPGPVTGSAGGSPRARGYIAELNYLPVQNVRLMLQYTGYTQISGMSGAGYDGVTPRNPRDNNTLMFNVWISY